MHQQIIPSEMERAVPLPSPAAIKPPAESPEYRLRPRKKVKSSSTPASSSSSSSSSSLKSQRRSSNKLTVDEVYVLTHIGISNYRLGKLEKAERYFSEALRLRHPGDVIVDKSDQCGRGKTSMTTSSYANNNFTSVIPSNIHGGASSETRSQQKYYYDEGMRAFDEPLPFHELASQDAISCLLFYNSAQTQVNRREYRTALCLFQNALTLSSQAIDVEPETVSKIHHNLGYCNYRLSEPTKALEHYQAALKISDHNDNLRAYALNCIGVLIFRMGMKKQSCPLEALECLEESLAIVNAGGATFKHIARKATLLNNIGRVEYTNKNYSNALARYRQSLDLRQQELGERSVDLAATLFNVGQTLQQMGQPEDAMSYYENFMVIARKNPIMDSRDIAIVLKCMGQIYQEQWDFENALQCFQDSFNATRATMGDWHPEVASILNKLGNLYYEKKELDNAMECYVQGLEIEKKTLPLNHPHIIVTMTNIAGLFKQKGDHDKALALYQAVYKMQASSFGQNTLEVAVTLSNIGLMQYHRKEYGASFESYQSALRIRRNHHQTLEHADIASNLNSLGLVLFKIDSFQTSKQCFLESLRIRTIVFGPNHRDVAINLYNLATICFEVGEDEEAIKYYKETLRVEKLALGADHQDYAETLLHVGKVHQQLGDLQEAMALFSEAMDIQTKRQDTYSMIQILNLLGNLHLQQGNTRDMMKCFVESSRLNEAIAASQADGEIMDTTSIPVFSACLNFHFMSKLHPPAAPQA